MTWLTHGALAVNRTGSLNLPSGGAGFTNLFQNGANALDERNGVNSQTLQIFRTFTDASNGEWLSLAGTLGGGMGITTRSNGTGSPVALNIGVESVEWSFNTTGVFAPNQDNVFDLGTSSLQIRDIYIGRNLFVAGGVNSTIASPASLSTNQNDYNPSGAGIWRLTSSTAVTITGIAGGVAGRNLTISNIGTTFEIELADQSASSSAANRIITGLGAGLLLGPNATVDLYYDSVDSRWRVRS